MTVDRQCGRRHGKLDAGDLGTCGVRLGHGGIDL
jgi:hypothetical protein